MPGSQIRQEIMEVATSSLKGEAMVNKIAEVSNNPEEKDEPGGVEPISHLMKSPY